jgi:hypothetical protein
VKPSHRRWRVPTNIFPALPALAGFRKCLIALRVSAEDISEMSTVDILSNDINGLALERT